jgi:hypothetical protein
MKTIALIGVLAALLLGCAGSVRMAPVTIDSIREGSYRLILYGGQYRDDPVRAAFLDLEGDDYIFRPVAIASLYLTFEHMRADEAVERARGFLGDQCAFRGASTRELSLSEGNVVGYEVLPQYEPGACPESNAVLTSYAPGEGGLLRVYVRLQFRNENEMFRLEK